MICPLACPHHDPRTGPPATILTRLGSCASNSSSSPYLSNASSTLRRLVAVPELISGLHFWIPRIHARGGKNGCPAGHTPHGGMDKTWPPIRVASRKIKPSSTQLLSALRQCYPEVV